MNTQEIMNLALELSGLKEVPADSAIYVAGSEIRKILFGIDIDTAELVLAQNLNCDAVISHHPNDTAINWYLPEVWKVYEKHAELMIRHGVPEEVAKAAVEPRINRLKTDLQVNNFDRVVSVGRLLKMPFMNIHQPLDEIGRRILQAKTDEIMLRKGPNTRVRDLMNGFYEIPEIARVQTRVLLQSGDPEAIVQKAVVAHGCLTNGGYHVATAYFKNGIDTVIYITLSHDDALKLQQEGLGNVIVTGHIASDSIGINPLINALQKQGIEVIAINGIV
jgi:putative NIF3 family GTP cyclohydrolase 1 type 2